MLKILWRLGVWKTARAKAASNSGQGLAEFIILVVVVALIVLASVRLFGKSVSCEFDEASREIDQSVGSSSSGCPTQIASNEPEPPPPPPPPLPPLPPPPPPTPPPRSSISRRQSR